MNVFFDLDGTLIDSFSRHYIVLYEALKCYGIDTKLLTDEKDFRFFKRNGESTETYLINHTTLNGAEIDKVISYWKKHIEDEEQIKHDCLFPDTIDCLSKLCCKHHIYYLTSRSDNVIAEKEIKHLGIDIYSEEYFIVNPPDAMMKKSAVLHSFRGTRMVFVGDTEMDYYSAKNSGTHFIPMNRGFRSKEYWDGYMLNSFSNLEDVIKIIIDRKDDNNAQHE